LFSIANASLFSTAFVQSFGFWFVTDSAKAVWIVFWISFITVNINTFTSVMFATSSRKFFFVNELLTFWTNVSFIESTTLSECSDIFTSGNTIVVTATWHASIIFKVPFMSDWIFFVVVDASIWWWNTFFGWATASSLVFNKFDGTSDHARWIWDEEWAMFFTFTSVNLTTLFIIDVSTFVKFFFSTADWNWNIFVWEHHSALVWISFIDTSWWIDRSAFPRDTAISPVVNMVVFVRFTSWSGWAPGSLVKANSLLVIVQVDVVGFETKPSFIKRVITVNNSLSVLPLVTVTSFTVVPAVSESVSTREGVSGTVPFDFTNVIFNWITAALFWLFTTARINSISPSFKTTFVFLLTVYPVVPVVVVVLQVFALLSLVDFLFFSVWTFVTNTFVTVTTFI
jgi:hypothetical protein